MLTAYLWLNAIIYFAFAAWCTVAPSKTSQTVGYTVLDAAGRSEFLVVYGGLQIGLGLFFAYLALNHGLQRVALNFSLMLYVPIVLYRVVSVAINWPVSGATLAIGVMEAVLLAMAIGLYFLAPSTP